MSSSEDLKPKRASGKRCKKRKFHGNVYTAKYQCLPETHEANKSASERKIGMISEVDINEVNNKFNGYRIIDIHLLFSSLENCLCCKICGNDVTITEEVICGLSSKVSVACKTCNDLCSFRNSTMIGERNNIADINRRFVYAMRTNGMGYAAMQNFCGVMDLPKPVSRKAYNSSVKKLVKVTESVAQDSMKFAADEEINLTGSANINVSGDGTWKTRGHTSRVGVCTIIGDKTGKVIDTEVLSSYCKSCDSWKKRKGSKEYDDWKMKHHSDCLINHSGSAGKMEMVGMVRIFQRSENKHHAKYIGYIGDGDSKTFQAITEANPYGDKITITKIECVGHIQKRMGTRLRKIKQSGKKCSDGKSIGGKGRLTDKLIDKLTSYYGNAIREHKTCLPDMRKAVWAIFFHTRSTDSEPLHNFCPEGSESWCCYQKAVANNNLEHFTHKKTIPTCVMDTIKQIFNDLSHPKLLTRCLGGKTQNNNESINSMIWKLCSKTQGTGRNIAEIATNEAVILFNEGSKGRMKVMEGFGMLVGSHARQHLTSVDEKRIRTSNLRFLQSSKEARKIKRRQEKIILENFTVQEGETYAAGTF